MLGLQMLDVALGLVIVFSLVALVCSALREAVETLVKSRAVFLERGIRGLLNDPKGTGMAKDIFEHPLVSALFTKSAYKPMFRLGRGMPSYIPSKNFSAALLDIVLRGKPGARPRRAAATFDEIRTVIESDITNKRVQRALLSAFDRADGDLNAARANIEAWYDSAMDRVSGWFKRRTQIWLFVLGACAAYFLNVNTIILAQHLATDKAAREALVAMAPEIAKSTENDAVRQHVDKLYQLGLPIGWPKTAEEQKRAGTDCALKSTAECDSWESYYQPLLGWLITALAVSLGAPFWFDLLNRLMVIRSTVKPHEKSPEEGSEDR